MTAAVFLRKGRFNFLDPCGSRCHSTTLHGVSVPSARDPFSHWTTHGASLESRKSSSSSDEWKSFIPFSSQHEYASVKGDGDRWSLQATSVEPEVKPVFQLTPFQQDAGLTLAVLLGAYLWVRLFDLFTSRHIFWPEPEPKLVHITSGLCYMLSWPFFSFSSWAPFIAGLVPLANGIRLIIYGLGILEDKGLVKSMSRTNESRELLRGPLYYIIVLYLSTVLFWRRSPVGVIALAMMCGGDGIADIMGRKFGSKKLPYNNDKSFAGSISMFLFGFLVSSIFVYYFKFFGFFELELYSTARNLLLISFAATVVESLPITAKLDDNFTVPVTAFVLGIFLFPS